MATDGGHITSGGCAGARNEGQQLWEEACRLPLTVFKGAVGTVRALEGSYFPVPGILVCSLWIVPSCFTIVVVYSLKGTSIIRRQTLPYLSSLCRNNLQLLEQFQQSQQVRITLFKGRKSRCHSLGITSLGTVMFDGHNSTPLQQVQDIPQFWILNLVVVSNKVI